MIMVKAVVYISIRQILLEDHRNHTQHFSNLMINKTLSLKCHIYEFIMSNRVFYNFGIHLHYVPFCLVLICFYFYRVIMKVLCSYKFLANIINSFNSFLFPFFVERQFLLIFFKGLKNK